MKYLIVCLTCLWMVLSVGQALAQNDLPAEVREAAIADLNARIPGLGRPSFWQFQIGTSNNTNLGCDLIPSGQGLASPIRVYIVDFVYPNGARYTYRITSDLTYILPCDLKLTSLTPAATPTQVLSTPANPAQYAYTSQTCPAELDGYTPSRIQVGQFGLARVGDPVILYSNFDATSSRIATISNLNMMYILAGPECTPTDGVVWWQVEWNGQVGWTAESRLGGYYFLDPLTVEQAGISVPPTQTLPPTATPTLTATPSPSLTLTSTLTFTPTITPSQSVTPSETPTETHTPTETATPTETPSPTETFTATPSPTETLTPSPTFTPTETPPPAVLIPAAEDRAPIEADNAPALTELGQIEGQFEALVWREDALILGGEGGLTYWDAQTLQPVEASLPFEENVTALSADSTGRFMVVGGENGLLVLVDWNEPDAFQMLPNTGDDVRRILFNQTGQFVNSTDGAEATLKLWIADPQAWNTPNGLVMIVPQAQAVTDVAFSADGVQVASLDADNVYIFDSQNGQTVFIQPLEREAECGGLAFEDGALLYADCSTVWRVDTQTLEVTNLLEVDTSIRGLTLSPDGDLLVVQTDSAVLVYAQNALEVPLMEIEGAAQSVDFDPTGSVLSIGYGDRMTFWGVGVE